MYIIENEMLVVYMLLTPVAFIFVIYTMSIERGSTPVNL